MKTQHTPGPWTLRDRPNSGGGHYIEPGIATVHGAGRIPDANARLIAAAPDLLAALCEVRQDQQDLDEVSEETIERICAAIAKATGGNP